MPEGFDKSDRDIDNSIVDPLLDCLVFLSQIYHRPFSREALRAGLPLVNHKLTPLLFVRAAQRAGFSGRILKKPLSRMSNLILPAVLLLKNDQAYILQKINDDQTVDIVTPDSGGVSKVAMTALEENYQGFAIFVKPAFQFESRSESPTTDINQQSWFWGTIWRYRAIYTQVILAAFFINIFALVSTLFVMTVYDRVIPNYALTTLWVLLIGIITIFIFDLILRTLRSYLIDVCGKKADIIIASKLFESALGIQLAYKPTSVGAFVNNMREFEVLRDFITSSTLTTLIDIPFTILYFALIAYLGGSIVFIPITIIFIVLIIAYFLEKPIRRTLSKSLRGAAQKNAILVESITGLETVKCLSIEGEMQRRWEQSVSQTAKYGLRSRFYSSFVVNLTNLAQQLIYILTVTAGVFAIHQGTLTLGGLIACNILVGRILAPLTQFVNILTRFEQSRMSLTSLQKIIDIPQERPIQKNFLHRPKLTGDIEFENVTFQYPGQAVPALDHVSFKIKSGERIAVLGHIGSGKSTVHKLILGLYQPQSGSIRIDGIDINQIDPVDLRRAIGYVPQDSLLFFGSVRDNIALTVPWASDIAIANVAKIAGVDSFVNLNPKGFDMLIGERGEGISGGQRQSIAIARALLPNPSIWLFDEPTSAMDNQSEAELLMRLSKYLYQKTLILVTHRTTLLPLVERVLVLDKGRLVFDGNKEKVLATMQKNQTKSEKPEDKQQQTRYDI